MEENIHSASEHYSEILNRLATAIADAGETHIFPPGKIFRFPANKTSNLYILQRGACSVYRKSDNLMINIYKEVMLFGLLENYYPSGAIYFKTKTTATLTIVPFYKAIEIIEKENLWKDMNDFTLYVLKRLREWDAQIMSGDAYNKLRHAIIEYANLSPEIREKMSLVVFLMKKTKLSRSSVMKMMAVLRQRDLIEGKRANFRITGKLPENL